MKKDIYLDKVYSPIFYNNEIAIVDNSVKLQALRNNVRNQINTLWIDSIRSGRILSDKDLTQFVALVSTQAQLLNIDLNRDQLDSLKFSVIKGKLEINLNI